jgi:hypothetical protein
MNPDHFIPGAELPVYEMEDDPSVLTMPTVFADDGAMENANMDDQDRINEVPEFVLTNRVARIFRIGNMNGPVLSLTEACKLLEREPRIEWGLVAVYTGQQSIDGSINVWGVSPRGATPFDFIDQVFDADVWTRFGRAVRNSRTLNHIILRRPEVWRGANIIPIDGDLPVAAARCIGAFFSEVKHSKSISRAEIDLRGAPMEHLCEFVQYSEALVDLRLSSKEPYLGLSSATVSLEQSTHLSSAIVGSIKLREVNFCVDIRNCCFEDDGSFERLLEGCSKVPWLKVFCEHNWQSTAVAALLRNASIEISQLDMYLKYNLDREQVARDISSSLLGNRYLRSLWIAGGSWQTDDEPSYAPFEDYSWELDHVGVKNLLCDVSSIETIVNSNHTLTSIYVEGHDPSRFAIQCLNLNKNGDKTKVIRDKIRQFYFVGEYNISPFTNMPLSILPEVMSSIKGNDKQSAIYRLLRGIPEVCNVSGRECSEQPGNKGRQNMVGSIYQLVFSCKGVGIMSCIRKCIGA